MLRCTTGSTGAEDVASARLTSLLKHSTLNAPMHLLTLSVHPMLHFFLHLISRGAQTCDKDRASDLPTTIGCTDAKASVLPVLLNSSNSVFLWVLSSCICLYGLCTSSLGSRNVHSTKPLVPLIAWSYDHQNHSKWHKWCHVRYNLFLFVREKILYLTILKLVITFIAFRSKNPLFNTIS